MKHRASILFLFLVFAVSAVGQDFTYKKSAQPRFTNEEWTSDIAAAKIYDDDVIVEKIRIVRSESLLDTLLGKMRTNAERYAVYDERYGELCEPGKGSSYCVFGQDLVFSEFGDGEIDFYSTKFKNKHTCHFYYFISTVRGRNYLNFLIDIEHRGEYSSISFMINDLPAKDSRREMQWIDLSHALADYKLTRTR